MECLIGKTPLLRIPHPKARIFAKWEGANLTGSSKDRAALFMLNGAALYPGATVVEATSGNTGISLAALCAARGLECRVIMPENMSRERIARMEAYGAQVLLTPADRGMAGAVALAKKMAEDDPDVFYVNQFSNPANPLAHYCTTGPEIWRQSRGGVELFLAGVGSGGTVSGTGRFLKERNPAIQIFGVDPAPGDPIPGLGAGFLPKILDTALLDGRIPVTAAEAERAARYLARRYGIFAGPSSGAAFAAAWGLADLAENSGKTIITVFPDTGCRYLSTG